MESSKALGILRVYLSIPFSRRRMRAFKYFAENDCFAVAEQSDTYPILAWSQDGEDICLRSELPESGFYVDVGAHHPDRFSVTRDLYRQGWRGINIDDKAGFWSDFSRERPRDINVKALIGAPAVRQLTRFEESALTTLNEDRASALVAAGWRSTAVETVHVRSLAEVLSQHVEPRPIDFLSVDVEGLDLEVLESHDWERWPVRACLVEVGQPAFAVPEDEISKFLRQHGLLPTRVWARSVLYQTTAFSGAGGSRDA